jgi:hypothetical protein
LKELLQDMDMVVFPRITGIGRQDLLDVVFTVVGQDIFESKDRMGITHQMSEKSLHRAE